MKLCYVTDRKALPGSPQEQMQLLLEKIESVAQAGIDWIQIREKDLEARALMQLVQASKRCVRGNSLIFVNDRLDVALAAGADGVHLGELSLPVQNATRFVREHPVGRQFLIGVSTHSPEAVREAAVQGADYAIFGPVFATPSKAAYGTAQGLEQLRAACRAVAIPVMAIGGVAANNAGECVAAGAAGIAAIRLFQDAGAIQSVVNTLRAS